MRGGERLAALSEHGGWDTWTRRGITIGRRRSRRRRKRGVTRMGRGNGGRRRLLSGVTNSMVGMSHATRQTTWTGGTATVGTGGKP